MKDCNENEVEVILVSKGTRFSHYAGITHIKLILLCLKSKSPFTWNCNFSTHVREQNWKTSHNGAQHHTRVLLAAVSRKGDLEEKRGVRVEFVEGGDVDWDSVTVEREAQLSPAAVRREGAWS